MATSNVTFGTKKQDGNRQVQHTPVGGSADVTITIASPPTMSRGEFLEACKIAADQLGLR
jgi:hypothetical protein